MIIYLDLDGVVVDFVSAALKLFDAEHLQKDWPPGEWDITNVLGVSATDFWSRVDARGELFWKNLQVYPWAGCLLNLIDDYEWYYATSPSRSHRSSSGKVLWMQEQHGTHFRRYVLGEHKHLLAKSDALLIDDNQKNVERFVENGGKSILFPRPWNRLHHIDEPMGYVKEMLVKLVGSDAGSATNGPR